MIWGLESRGSAFWPSLEAGCRVTVQVTPERDARGGADDGGDIVGRTPELEGGVTWRIPVFVGGGKLGWWVDRLLLLDPTNKAWWIVVVLRLCKWTLPFSLCSPSTKTDGDGNLRKNRGRR